MARITACVASSHVPAIGAAMAAYCAKAGIEAYVFCPEDTPEVNA